MKKHKYIIQFKNNQRTAFGVSLYDALIHAMAEQCLSGLDREVLWADNEEGLRYERPTLILEVEGITTTKP